MLKAASERRAAAELEQKRLLEDIATRDAQLVARATDLEEARRAHLKSCLVAPRARTHETQG